VKFLPGPPERAVTYLREHPDLIVTAAVLLVGFNLYNLIESVGLYHKARQLVSDLQREASEALGG
jgi:hypothetical protein